MESLTLRQEEIIRAAMGIIEEQGAQELSFRKIADRIGISEPAIYRHFVNKDDLLVRIVFYSINLLTQIIGEKKDAGGDAVSIIEEIFEGWIEVLTKEIPITRIFYLPGMFINDAPVVEEIIRTKVELEEFFKELIERGRREGSIRSDLRYETIKLLIGGPLQFLVHEWALTGESYDLRARWRSVWEEVKLIIGRRVADSSPADMQRSRT